MDCMGLGYGTLSYRGWVRIKTHECKGSKREIRPFATNPDEHNVLHSSRICAKRADFAFGHYSTIPGPTPGYVHLPFGVIG